jgi:hypothetical protein
VAHDHEDSDGPQNGDSPRLKRGLRTGDASRLPAVVVVFVIIAGQWWLARDFDFHPVWLFPLVSGVLLVTSIAFYISPKEPGLIERTFAVCLAALLVLVNIGVLVAFIYNIFAGSSLSPIELLIGGAVLWIVNVLVFSIAYWELDCGGFERRIHHDYEYPDFVFPQQQDKSGKLAPHDWEASFFDYLYLSLTNSTAFSPTDTMPYSKMAKFMMGIQGLFSFMVFAILIARSVNIASG